MCTRTVVVYLGQLEEHRPVPKQMAEGSNRPLVFQNGYMRAVFWIMSQFCLIASLGGYVNVKLSHKFILVEDTELI